MHLLPIAADKFRLRDLIDDTISGFSQDQYHYLEINTHPSQLTIYTL